MSLAWEVGPRPWVNVLDDYSDPNEAFAAAAGGTAYVPPQGIVISSPLTIPDNTEVLGPGTIKVAGGSVFSQAAIWGGSGVKLRKVTFDFNTAGATYTNSNYGGLTFLEEDDIELIACRFLNSFSHAIRLSQTTDFLIQACRFYGISPTGVGDGIYCDTSTGYGEISACRFPDFGRQAIGLSNTATNDIDTLGNIVISKYATAWNAIALGSLTRGTCAGNTVVFTVAPTATVNAIDIGNTTDVEIGPNTVYGGGFSTVGGIGDAPPATNPNVHDNTVAYCGAGGISLGSANYQCEDNIVHHCKYGILAGGGVAHWKLHGNKLFDNGVGATGQQACGIWVFGQSPGTTDGVLSENECYDDGAGTQLYGVFFQANGNSDYLLRIIMLNNKLDGNVTAAFTQNGNYPIRPGDGHVFRGNAGLNPVGLLSSAGTLTSWNYKQAPTLPASGSPTTALLVDALFVWTCPSGSSISGLAIGGQTVPGLTVAAGASSPPIFIPAGQTMTPTYTGTPTVEAFGS